MGEERLVCWMGPCLEATGRGWLLTPGVLPDGASSASGPHHAAGFLGRGVRRPQHVHDHPYCDNEAPSWEREAHLP